MYEMKRQEKCGEFRKRKGDIKSVWKVLTYNWESGFYCGYFKYS